MKHVYVIVGYFCEDMWIDKVVDSLEKAENFLDDKGDRSMIDIDPLLETWTHGYDLYMIRRKEVE